MRPAIAFTCVFLLASSAHTHPVPPNNHDRTIVVILEKGDMPNRIRVRVEYRVEVAEVTVALNDMKEFADVANPLDYRGRMMEYYAEFAKIYAPIYADRLVVRVNKAPIKDFRLRKKPVPRLEDEEGKGLGHLRCDFVFESEFDLKPANNTQFVFRDATYINEEGQIVLSLINEAGLTVESMTAPDDALRKRALTAPEPGDDDRLRTITFVFAPTGEPTVGEPSRVSDRLTEAPAKTEPAPPSSKKHTHDDSLLRLVLRNDYGVIVTLLLAFLFGAAHALTPGHGKTLVAAYLVGERGTVWHACFLGLVTTLTHTGVVIVLAVILTLLPKEMQSTFQSWIQNGLGLVMGLLVTCMGFWLLLQRLAGRADHVHLDGGHHHHGPGALNWWGLVVLGVTGGLVPCWDAIVLLCYAVGSNHFWLVLPAVLAFSAGLAVVLVLIGVFVVQVPRFVESRWGNGRVVQALPIVSAVLVTLMGLWLCYEGVQGK